MMTRRAKVLLSAAALATAAGATPVPFVGCRSDGQLGPQAPPRKGRMPDVSPSAAPALAFYAMHDGTAVLAPRGWHCFGAYGSNGSTLLVTPRPVDWKAFISDAGFRGPAVQLSLTFGGTSGRFEVAEIAARAFPAARDFVAEVEAEGMNDKPLPRGPYPADKRTYRGPYQLLFTTPAGQKGLGTRSKLVPDALPIDGVEWLHPGDDMDLTSLAARLPPAQRALVAEIIRQAAPPPRR